MYVFEHGIHRMLTRQKRTAILVTQQLQLVHRADNVSQPLFRPVAFRVKNDRLLFAFFVLEPLKRCFPSFSCSISLLHQIVALERGSVSATGSPTEIENNYPHIHREWNAIIAKEQQRRQSSIAQAR